MRCFRRSSPRCVQWFAFDRSTIFLYDDAEELLRLVVAESAIPSEHFVPGFELPLDKQPRGLDVHQSAAVLRPDLAQERNLSGRRRAAARRLPSLIVVPLIVRGKSIGTLNLGSEQPMQYGEAEAELLQEVANQVALAIENMREYEEIGRLKAQLERENVYLREEILGEHNFEEIVGNSPALLDGAAHDRTRGAHRLDGARSSARPAPARSWSRARSTAAARAASIRSSR